MSEITVNIVTRQMLWPTTRPSTYLIDPVAFFLALFGAPLLVAALGFWAIIPVFAVPFGAPFYLIIGTPLILRSLSRRPPKAGQFAAMAFIANFATPLLYWAYAIVFHTGDTPESAMIFFGFGAMFAPLWGGGFAMIYRLLQRDFYKTPITGELT